MKSFLKLTVCAASLAIGAQAAHAETRVGVSMTSFDNPFLTILLNGIHQAYQFKIHRIQAGTELFNIF